MEAVLFAERSFYLCDLLKIKRTGKRSLDSLNDHSMA